MKQTEPITWNSVPQVLRVASSKPGQLVIFALAALLLVPPFGYYAVAVAIVLLAAGNLPAKRRKILSGLAAVLFLTGAVFGSREWESAKWITGSLICFLALQLLWAQAIPRLPKSVNRYAVPLLHAILIAFIATVWRLRLRGAIRLDLALALGALALELLWRGSYWIRWQVRQNGQGAFLENLFALIPFVGTGGIPYGKGPDFFTRYEATDSRQLAISRLKGLHLLVLALLWSILSAIIQSVIFSLPAPWVPGLVSKPLPSPEFPLLPMMRQLFQDPSLLALWMRWGALLVELMRLILALATNGHRVVALYCLAGFAIPRNTDNPLLANSLVDFWARYWYYFKEVLMDFFFFPVFLRLRGLPLIPRTLAATAAAAFVGNLYFHLFVYAPQLMKPHGGQYADLAQLRVIFCAILAAGLCWSFTFLLMRKSNANKTRWARFWRTARWIRLPYMVGVTAFFALLHVWTYGDAAITLRDRLHLLLAMFDPS